MWKWYPSWNRVSAAKAAKIFWIEMKVLLRYKTVIIWYRLYAIRRGLASMRPPDFRRRISYFSLTDNFHDIVVHHKYHQNHKHHKAGKMHKPFLLRRNRFPPDDLKEHEHQPPAVQCRKRKQIHDAEIDGK